MRLISVGTLVHPDADFHPFLCKIFRTSWRSFDLSINRIMCALVPKDCCSRRIEVYKVVPKGALGRIT